MDKSRKMESNIDKMWSFAKQTEKRVEDLYSGVKKVSLFRLSFVLFIFK